MRNYDTADEFKKIGFKPHEILITVTSEPDYQMERKILLEEGVGDGVQWGEYLLLEGSHCSCYDFDETYWEGTVYTQEELVILANAVYNQNDMFWKLVKEQMC